MQIIAGDEDIDGPGEAPSLQLRTFSTSGNNIAEGSRVEVYMSRFRRWEAGLVQRHNARGETQVRGEPFHTGYRLMYG